MRILLLCSSLEPGRDGVGDHVRMLAEACGRRGHTCALIALRDPHAPTVSEGQEKSGIPFLRLPSTSSALMDISAATGFRDRFRPDWISLHLVAYGLHPKGLLFRATPFLAGIVGDTPLQLMLHELWLGNDEAPSWRHRIMGFLQRASLGRLLSRLRPRLVATSNPVYAALLQNIGVEAEIVPLFGNIPILTGTSLPGCLAEAGITSETRAEWWIGLFFGGLYRVWLPELFFRSSGEPRYERASGSVSCSPEPREPMAKPSGGNSSRLILPALRSCDFANSRKPSSPRSCSRPISAWPPRRGASSAKADRRRRCSTMACR